MSHDLTCVEFKQLMQTQSKMVITMGWHGMEQSGGGECQSKGRNYRDKLKKLTEWHHHRDGLVYYILEKYRKSKFMFS